jgi:hypothetical protein
MFGNIPDMIEDFIEEKDTLSEYQLQQITDFVNDYMNIFN